ncbi:hypothetical protein K7432_004209 [Basidiobolus ranarum]|uniref:Uncharacterized protein n=1 Tax=Basidiobolus ranarum TaxID=34480 RepID=A0ABR2W4Y3_9FUNG
MSEVYIPNFKLNNERSTTKLPSFELEQPSFQFSLSLRPNICVTCLTCLTCAGKYGTNDCHCPASEIHWNKRRQGYKVEFRRRCILPNNRVFMTWLKANLSQRLIWEESCKEVKLCMACNSICRRWAKVFNEGSLASKPTPRSDRFRTSRFSPTGSPLSNVNGDKGVQGRVVTLDKSPVSPLRGLASKLANLNSVVFCQDYVKTESEQTFLPLHPQTLNTKIQRANSMRKASRSSEDDDIIFQSSSPSPSPSPRLQTPPNRDFAPLVTYDLAHIVASASPKGSLCLFTSIVKSATDRL